MIGFCPKASVKALTKPTWWRGTPLRLVSLKAGIMVTFQVRGIAAFICTKYGILPYFIRCPPIHDVKAIKLKKIFPPIHSFAHFDHESRESLWFSEYYLKTQETNPQISLQAASFKLSRRPLEGLLGSTILRERLNLPTLENWTKPQEGTTNYYVYQKMNHPCSPMQCQVTLANRRRNR